MAKLFWTPRATRCLTEVATYLSEHNPAASDSTIRGILQKVDVLRRFPQLGPPLAHGKRKGLRQVMFGPYRIIYEIVGAQINIIAVYHGARDLRKLL